MYELNNVPSKIGSHGEQVTEPKKWFSGFRYCKNTEPKKSFR